MCQAEVLALVLRPWEPSRASFSIAGDRIGFAFTKSFWPLDFGGKIKSIVRAPLLGWVSNPFQLTNAPAFFWTGTLEREGNKPGGEA